jgi:drug/metabolite transporter (DMT)-like permease
MTRRAWVAFAASSLIWGVPYLFIKIAVDHGMTPPVLAWGRVTLGALVLLVLAWRAGTLRTVVSRWRWLLAFAVAEIAIPFPMLAIGEERVPSSLAAIMVAAVPLIGAILAMRFDHSERPTPIRALGLAIGFGGVIALVGIDVAGHKGELIGIGAIMITATGYAIGPMLIKHRLAGLDPRATMGASLALASLILLPWAALDVPAQTPSAGAIGSVIVLGLLCTAIGFVVYAILIGEAGTSRATVITYVNPVVAVTLGVLVLGEQPGAGAIAGLLLILAGGWLATDGRLPPGLMRGLAALGVRGAVAPREFGSTPYSFRARACAEFPASMPAGAVATTDRTGSPVPRTPGEAWPSKP